MKIAKLSDILGIIGKIAPFGLTETWDNSGLQLGDPLAEISRIMVALDATPAVVESAISSGCQLLVTHHPLIFKALNTISSAAAPGRQIHAAIRGGLAVISMHTNYDIAEGGLNDLLAERIGLAGCAPLQVTSTRELAKLVVFVPEEQFEQVRQAMLPHTEILGAYRDCSFAVPGEGTFTPLAGAKPFIGSVGELERVAERRLELLIDRAGLGRAIKTLVNAHPYEEPAFDLYPLLNEGARLGLGRIGRLAEPVPLAEFSARISENLPAAGLRYVGDPESVVAKVALCSGGGASLMRTAARVGADVLLTGDVKYHDARDAEELGIALIDAGHFPTEIIMVEEVAGRLARMLAAAGYAECEVVPCRVEHDPFRYSRTE